MKTVKAKIKGTDTILEGSICDDLFFVSIDHDTFERYDLEELEICKESLHIPETCKEKSKSFTYTFDVPDNDGFLVFTPMDNQTIRKVLKLKKGEGVTLTIRKYENNKI